MLLIEQNDGNIEKLTNNMNLKEFQPILRIKKKINKTHSCILILIKKHIAEPSSSNSLSPT